jgi:hypothetical protein
MEDLVAGVNKGSSNQYKCPGGNIDLNCVNCDVLNEKTSKCAAGIETGAIIYCCSTGRYA